MAFFQQLKLLLWKNWLTVIRQPIWSVTLVAWPVIIFVIIAVTRHQFPPVIKEACYVKPRNLPSTGVLPFLQTLMCNTDSTCEATSQLVEKSASTKARNSPFLPNLKNVPLNFTQNEDPAKLLAVLNNMLGTSEQGGFYVNVTNTTSVGDKETLKKNLGSMKVIKKVICTLLHPMMNRTLPKPLSYALHSFCKSNSTPFEASLGTLNMILAKLMETNPEEMAKLAGAALLVFDRLQNETSLWETLLAFPRVFSSGSIYEALASTDVLLTNIYKSVRVIKKHFPEAGESFSGVSSLIDLSLPLIRYAQSWPGKGVKISLGDVLIEDDGVNFDTLKNFQLSLDLAIVLVLDKQTAYDCLCSVYKKSTAFNSTDQLCAEGVLRHALERVSPSQLIKQIFTAWSQQVAAADISFAKSQLQSMMGYGGHDVSNMGRRARRSVGAQDQYIDLVLDVGHVVMEIVKGGPYEELFGSYILGFGFEYMKTAAQALDFVETFLGNALNDIGNLRQTYLMLMTNQSVAEMWISRVFDSAFEAILKSIVSENSTCGDILSSFEWLLNTSSTDIKLWNTLICQNRSALSIIQMNILQFFTEPLPTPEGNITLSIFVAELHKLYNKTLRFGAFLERVTAKLHAMNWISDRTHDIPETLQKSFFTSLVNFGEMLEKTQLWPMLENYFHMAFWILNYRAGVTTQPPNCTLISVENILCNTGFKWPQFVHEMVQALMSPNQDVLSNCLKGSVTLLQHLYGDLYRLRVQLGDDIQSAYLTNLVLTLDSFIHNISKFTDQQITNSNIMAPLVGRLFHVTGLSPLLPFIFSNHPLNFSTLLDVASTIGRLNQQVLTFNVTDPSMAELELLTRQLCSLENLTLSVSHIVGHTLLTYSLYFKSDEVGRLKKGLQPFKNQTSAPYVEAIINAMEQLETVIDSSNGNPTQIILAYIQQLQGFVKSLSGLRKIQHVILPNGELSVVQVTDLSMMSNNILDLLSPESLRMLTQVGPDVAQNIVIQR
ncbi:uncharacterized protein [Antennarius striatus]|uniref:uncharacterized protein n=1 Tax=Antennarius striatus TaxID=241820 RepID=UPI0035B3470F